MVLLTSIQAGTTVTVEEARRTATGQKGPDVAGLSTERCTLCLWGSRYSDSLRAGRSRDRIPVGVRFSAAVPVAHPVSCTIGTGSFPGVKRPGRDVDHPAPPSADVKERVEQCLYFPPWAFMACYKENLGFYCLLSVIYSCIYIFMHFSFLSLLLSVLLLVINLTIFLLLVYTYKVKIGN